MSDFFDLDRFIAAQTDMFDIALAEIGRGAKRSHWMWFIFPQLAGLGNSANAKLYAIGSLPEARAFLSHALLGRRLRQCVEALQDLTGTRVEAVFGEVDAVKLRSSLTLFHEARAEPLFAAALERRFGGRPDGLTLLLLYGSHATER